VGDGLLGSLQELDAGLHSLFVVSLVIRDFCLQIHLYFPSQTGVVQVVVVSSCQRSYPRRLANNSWRAGRCNALKLTLWWINEDT
jgi:hypothetical protein